MCFGTFIKTINFTNTLSRENQLHEELLTLRSDSLSLDDYACKFKTSWRWSPVQWRRSIKHTSFFSGSGLNSWILQILGWLFHQFLYLVIFFTRLSNTTSTIGPWKALPLHRSLLLLLMAAKLHMTMDKTLETLASILLAWVWILPVVVPLRAIVVVASRMSHVAKYVEVSIMRTRGHSSIVHIGCIWVLKW